MEVPKHQFPRRNFGLGLLSIGLAPVLMACGQEPSPSFSMKVESSFHGTHFLFLPNGDARLDTGAYAVVFGRTPMIVQPRLVQAFQESFQVGAELVYTAENGSLRIRGRMQLLGEPKPRDTFVASVGLSITSLSFVVFTWKDYRFNPSLNYNNVPVNIQPDTNDLKL